MWFKALSLVIAAICLGKGCAALLAPQVFYGRRRQQYASARIPLSVLVLPIVMLSLTLIAWYATIMHHTAWSWLLTGFLTLISILGAVNLVRWSRHRLQLLNAIAEEQARGRMNVDLVIVGLGVFFTLLALRVF